MEPKEVVVCFGPSLSILQVSNYSDLLRQTRNTIPNLPISFEFSTENRKINSESAFQRINSTQGTMLTVIPHARKVNKPKRLKTGIIKDVPRVRLSNLAFINHEKTKNTDKIEVIDNTPDEMRCPICMEQLKRPMKAKCSHILCEICWDQTLARALECPLCRGHVRKKTLRSV